MIEKKNIKFNFIGLAISLLSIFLYTGFNKNYIVFLILFFLLKVNNIFRNKVIPEALDILSADIIVSFLILTIDSSAINNGIVGVRGKLHAISPILIPTLSFISFEYYSFFLKCKRSFEKFAANQSKWPLLAILVVLLNSFEFNFNNNTNFLGFIIPDLISIIHLGTIFSIIIYPIAILIDNSNNITRIIIKQIPFLLVLLFVLLCKSKITIFCSLLTLIYIFKEDLIRFLSVKRNIPKHLINSFIKSYSFILLIIFLTITIYSFNPFLMGKSNLFISKIVGKRQLINNSYIYVCSSNYLNKSFPSLTNYSELESRKIRNSKLFAEEISKIRKSLVNKYVDKGIAVFNDKEEILTKSPHYSLINYFCYHGLIYSILYIFLIIISTFLIIRFSSLKIALIFFISNGSLFFEYAYFIPSFFFTLFLAIYFLKNRFNLNK